jgi:hypothetical protein
MDIDPLMMVRLASVDRTIQNCKSIWAINYWTEVRRLLVKKILKDIQ